MGILKFNAKYQHLLLLIFLRFVFSFFQGRRGGREGTGRKIITMARVILTQREAYLSKKIVDAAYVVHKELGPGLLEKVYERCFASVLQSEGIIVERQVVLPITFREIVFEEGLRMDVLVDGQIICELKATENVHPVWEAQILSHLKLSNKRIGFLINFHVPLIKNGIRRYHHEAESNFP